MILFDGELSSFDKIMYYVCFVFEKCETFSSLSATSHLLKWLTVNIIIKKWTQPNKTKNK